MIFENHFEKIKNEQKEII